MKTTTLAKTLLATGIAVGLGFSQTALAANPTATDDLEVQVELAAGLTLVCGTLNFGTINVELGERTAENTVTVDGAGNASIGGGGNAALGGGDAAAATCTITGMNTADTKVSASINNLNPLDSLSGADTDDGGPTNAYSGLSVALDLFASGGSTSIKSGWGGDKQQVYTGIDATTSNFVIGGVLTIPDNDFVAANMGKYAASVTIEVEEEDA